MKYPLLGAVCVFAFSLASFTAGVRSERNRQQNDDYNYGIVVYEGEVDGWKTGPVNYYPKEIDDISTSKGIENLEEDLSRSFRAQSTNWNGRATILNIIRVKK